MIETSLFSDYFWGEKHQGFDVLNQNMKFGLKTSVDFLEFLKEVYSMEDTCTKSWLRLSKQLNVNSSGTIQPLWIYLKELCEKRSTVHMEVCHGMQVIIKFVQKYSEELQIKQKANKDVDAQTQNFSNMLLTTAGQLTRARDVYHTRHSELQKLNTSDQNPTKAREVEKAEVKLKKAVDEYKYLIEKYNNTCGKYKLKMNESSKNFQEIERYHLEQMKDFIQDFGNTLFKSQTEFRIHEKDFVNIQEKLTVDYLIESFIKSKATGRQAPELATFEEADINTSTSKLSKVSSETSNESGLSGNIPNDVAIGNLVNIDFTSEIPIRSHTVNNNAQPLKDCINDIFDRLSIKSDNNSTNNNSRSTLDLGQKKQRKYNNIFRRRKNSPTNGENNKPLQDLGKEQSSQSLGDILVDDEGFSIKPEEKWNDNPHDSDSDSSSGDDHGESTFKGIKIEIKPQESKSNSSSIPDVYTFAKVPEKENIDLIKAVQAIKINQPLSKNNLRRSSEHRCCSPDSSIVNNERVSFRTSSENEFSKLSKHNSRVTRMNSQSDQNSKSSQLNFQVDFDKSFESNGLDHIDPFISKFESLNKAKDVRVLEPNFDPWAIKPPEEQSKPPPLPAKIVPTRAASALPFTHPKISESSCLPAIPSIATRIPPPPSRVTINPIEGIPLAISFTETVNAKFREPFSSTPHDVHTNGQLVISFPCSMVQQLETIGESQLMSTEPIHFTLVKAARLRNVEPNACSREIIMRIENPSEDTFSIYIDLLALYRKLISQRHKEPSLPFFNIEMIKYDVTNNVKSNGSINAPVNISANWQFADPQSSHLIISYSFQWPNTNIGSLTFRPNSTLPSNADPEIQPRGEVRFLVSADGSPVKMQSLPPCVWNSERGRASWRIDLSAGRSSIKSKFILGNGPGTSQPVLCQFSAEGAIESGVLLQVSGSRFRISRHKYCLISGKYVWEPSAVLGGGGLCV